MKKVLFILMLMVSISILLAVESAPSETVGYFKKNVVSGTWEAFSYPFFQADMSVGTLIGDQGAVDDMIVDANTALLTQYYDGFGWFGDVVDLVPGAAYWYVRPDYNPTLDYFLMGKVNPQSVLVTFNGYTWTPWALNECRLVPVASLPLSGVQIDDMIVDAKTALLTQYYDGFGWFGDVTDIEPTHVYWYVANGPTYSWTYTPPARTAATSPFRSSKK